MTLVDYDKEQYRDYARGRAVTEEQEQAWISAFAAALPERRPLVGLDVGSGTGRFTPALARAFGPVTGVEPSVRMREIAAAQAAAPGVRYLAGSAENLPVPSASADYALLFLSWNHVQGKPRAVEELARVLRPAGTLLLRANFRDHHPRPFWLETCPRWFEVDAALCRPLHETIAMFTSAGWRAACFGTVTEPSSGTRAESLERLRLRTHSFFGRLTPEEIADGFHRLERAVAADPDAPAPEFAESLLTLERSQ